jgi:catechol 2,3-dioxygenase-like lactoylglutathione lyase family enzyme
MKSRLPARRKNRSTRPRLRVHRAAGIAGGIFHAMPTVNIQDIAFTVYPVTDMTRARSFYEGQLGLKPEAVYEKEGRHFIEYAIGTGTLALSNMSAGSGQPAPSGPAPCTALEVRDFDAAVAVMRRAQVPFAFGPLDAGVCHMAVVLDPDGNSLMLHHRHNT